MEPGRASLAGLVVRGSAGGVLTGLANLVPGISGGTMLVATGIYPRFVNAIAEVTTLKLKAASLAVLGSIVLSAALAVVMLAGVIKDAVLLHMWVAYSLFIGLTLGGIPVIWRMIGRARRSVWIGAGAGLVAMAALAVLQQTGKGAQAGGESSALMLLLAGAGGASAMVLPGISGGYILLVLGQYVPFLGAIEGLRAAMAAVDPGAAVAPMVDVLIPFGIGIVIGVIVISNIVKAVLDRYKDTTLGVLLGLLVGAVAGLWPFRHPVEPVPGQLFGGEILTEQAIEKMTMESWPTEIFSPAPGQVGAAILLAVFGFAITTAVAWLGAKLESRSSSPASPQTERSQSQ